MRLASLAFATLGLLATPALADDCADEIRAVMRAAMTSGPLHMETTITAPDSVMTMSGDLVPPNLRMTVDTNGEAVEMVILDGRAWMNVSELWVELPPDAAAEIASTFDLSDTAALDGLTDAQCNGTVNVDGEDYLSYSWNLSADGADTVNAILADPEAMVPLHMETEVTTGDVVNQVVVDYRYDDTITIVAPN